MTKKKLKTGSIPTLNMPKKSHQSETKSRQQRKSRIQNEEKLNYFYNNLDDIKSRITNLKCISDWKVEITTENRSQSKIV